MFATNDVLLSTFVSILLHAACLRHGWSNIQCGLFAPGDTLVPIQSDSWSRGLMQIKETERKCECVLVLLELH